MGNILIYSIMGLAGFILFIKIFYKFFFKAPLFVLVICVLYLISQQEGVDLFQSSDTNYNQTE
jgi:hypothetical protein